MGKIEPIAFKCLPDVLCLCILWLFLQVPLAGQLCSPDYFDCVISWSYSLVLSNCEYYYFTFKISEDILSIKVTQYIDNIYFHNYQAVFRKSFTCATTLL